MKKSVLQLLKVASKFQKKYGQSQNLQQIIENAASYGEQSANGIMDFPTQLKRDKADLSIKITVSSGILGGLSAKASDLKVTPPEFAGNYARLPAQIEKYLDRHLKDFPQIPQGETVLNYSGKGPASPEIARGDWQEPR